MTFFPPVDNNATLVTQIFNFFYPQIIIHQLLAPTPKALKIVSQDFKACSEDTLFRYSLVT